MNKALVKEYANSILDINKGIREDTMRVDRLMRELHKEIDSK